MPLGRRPRSVEAEVLMCTILILLALAETGCFLAAFLFMVMLDPTA